MERRRAFSVMQILNIFMSLVLSVCAINVSLSLSQSLTGADCLNKQTCGSLPVRYPFRLTSEPHCPSFSSFFDLECQGGDLYLNNFSYNNVTNGQVRVLHIQEDSLIVDASALSAVMPLAPDGNCTMGNSSLMLPAFPGPFLFADDNLIGSFGCDNMGVLGGAQTHKNTSTSVDDDVIVSNLELGGCSVLCPGDEGNPKCGGHTCCVSQLVQNTSYRVVLYFVISTLGIISTPCETNYATLFYPDYTDFSNQSYGLKLKWALPLNQINSTKDIKSSSNYACSNHSDITIVEEVPGYRCSCQLGFHGDGYSHGSSCSDVNECEGASNDCIPQKSTCHNNEGSYTCKCISRYQVGDGLMNGSGCGFSPTLRTAFAVIGGLVFLGFVIVGLIISALYWRRKIKRRYFLLNGGVQLQDIISKAGGKLGMKSKIFTAEELKAATENYAEHMKLGMGGFGTVYKGVLEDGRLVAIKKSNRPGQGAGNEEFLNEMQILMQINHRNIVRLLGCCMETVVPLLVYEFVGHGNVRENLDLRDRGFMGWEGRLKVARQIAEALAYLHAAASPPILHRDVKSVNVLLDDNLDAKVADFGASRLVPDDVQHVSTGVQGTIGYLDPEYFQTLQLTDKSDVYSFGVMLVELITGLKPIDSQSREPGFASLAILFLNHMQEARGEELIDPSLEDPSTLPINKTWDLAKVRSSIMLVAGLARRCLALHGADRPPMSYLADELRHITHYLEDFDNELDDDEKTPLMPPKSKLANKHHIEAGAVLNQDGNFFVHSTSTSTSTSIPTSTSISIHDLSFNVPTLPR